MIAWDTETFLIIPGLLAPPLVCGSFVGDDKIPRLLNPDETCDAVSKALVDGELLVTHNGVFDFAVVIAHRPNMLKPVFEHYKKGLVRCTLTRQKLLDIASGDLKFHEDETGQLVKTSFSLAALAHRHLGIELNKGSDTWRLRYQELSGVPLKEWPEEAIDYSLRDAVTTRDVYLAQGGDITNEIEQTQAAWSLHLASVWGIRTDGAKVTALKNKLEAEQASARRDLQAAGFFKAVPVSPAEIREGRVPEFYGSYAAKSRAGEKRPMRLGKDMAVVKAAVEAAYEGRTLPRTESGEVSTDKDALELSGNPLLQTLAEIAGIEKVLQTFLPVLAAGVSVPINPGFNVLVASGRTSSFRPNMQQIPSGRRIKGVRECFRARQDN